MSRYETVRRTVRRRVKCRYCGKSVVRTRTFTGSVSPVELLDEYARLGQMAMKWHPRDDGSDQCMTSPGVPLHRNEGAQ